MRTDSNFVDHLRSSTFLVASGDQALGSDTDGLIEPAISKVNLASGQLGIVNVTENAAHLAVNKFLTATNNPAGSAPNTVANLRYIKLAQGTPISADFSGAGGLSTAYSHPTVVLSQEIDGNNAIAFTGVAYAANVRNSFLVEPGTPESETTYEVIVGAEGRRKDKLFGRTNLDVINTSYTTPDYTGYTSALNNFVHNVAYQLDLQSAAIPYNPVKPTGHKYYVAFAINLAGGSGTALSSVAADTPIPFFKRGGTTYSYTPDAVFVSTLTAAIASTNLVNASTIEVIDPTTAGSGAAANCDAIYFMALDETPAVVTDREKSVLVRLRIGLSDNFGVTPTVATYPNEGEGLARTLRIEYNELARYQKYSQQWFGNTLDFLEAPQYIDSTVNYNVYRIFHKAKDFVNDDYSTTDLHQIVLLVPTTASTTITALNAVLAPWIVSSPNFELRRTPATAPALF